MQDQEQKEQQIWEYIDGTCNEADKQRIALQIEQETKWAEVYNELQTLHKNISGSIEQEQPHLRFTKNVMETIAAMHPLPAPKQYVNRAVIRGIAAFFIITISTMLIYAFVAVDWHSGTGDPLMPEAGLPVPDFKQIFSPLSLNIIIGINVLLGLVLLDTALRSKRAELR